MRRWIGLMVTIGILVGAGSTTLAQDDAARRIQAAYQDYETWDTYQVRVADNTDLALVAEGKGAYLWQRRERHIQVSGWYDVTNRDSAAVLLNVSGDSSASTESGGTNTPSSWQADLDVALRNGQLFWRGSYSANPGDTFALPGEWTGFSVTDADDIPAFVDLALGRYLLQEGADPFVEDYDSWLAAAESIEGPETITWDRRSRTQGELYRVEVDLTAIPDIVGNRFDSLTRGQEAIVDRQALLDSLYENSTLIWQVVLEPGTGRLLGQNTELDLNAKLGSEGLVASYATLNLTFSNDQTIAFSNINEAVDTSELPE